MGYVLSVTGLLGLLGLRTPCNPPLMFQSTRPYGARRPVWQQPMPRIRVSIHAPVRGATPDTDQIKDQSIPSFNPRARTGRDERVTV